jgi:hypothetical protein
MEMALMAELTGGNTECSIGFGAPSEEIDRPTLDAFHAFNFLTLRTGACYHWISGALSILVVKSSVLNVLFASMNARMDGGALSRRAPQNGAKVGDEKAPDLEH